MRLPATSTFFRGAGLIPVLLACHIVPFLSAVAQDGASESVGGKTTASTITVFVRAPSGEPLTTYALVRLYTSDGTPMGQVPATNGSQVTFRNVHIGSYSVEVEAPGYTKAREEVNLLIPGDVQVQVLLRAESETEPTVSPGSATPLLAPKAKKELDEGLEALRKQDYKEAEKHLEKARTLAPTHPDVLYLLGTLYVDMKDYRKGEELLDKAIEMNPENFRALATLGIVLTAEHKCDAAIAPLEKALRLSEASWEARWSLARCYYYQRKFQLALDQSRQALRDSNGNAPQIVLVEAASLTALGQYEESAAMLREFLEHHSDLPEAMRARRWLDHLQRTGKISRN